MNAYKSRIILFAFTIVAAVFIRAASQLAAEPLPDSVQTKVDRCIEYLDQAEAELNARIPHMAKDPLRLARERLESIQRYQNGSSWDHADVKAVRNRYDAMEKRYNEAQAKVTASASLVEEQLKKLETFHQFNAEATYPEQLVASHPTYLAAKALMDEIAAAGTDVQLESHSDYSMTKLNVEIWERNRDRLIQRFIDTAKEYTRKNAFRDSDWLDKVDQQLADLAKVTSADNPKLVEARTTADTMRAFVRQEQLEKAAKVFMRPEKYKGKDANALRTLAKKPVLAKFPKAAILKIKLVSSGWGPQEGGAQWTDNTMSAVEVRTTSYFSVEVAAKQGQAVWLHRVYLYKSKVNGQMQPASSYVVGSQMMLEKNVK